MFLSAYARSRKRIFVPTALVAALLTPTTSAPQCSPQVTEDGVATWFCRPARITPRTPVQLLVHGATYDHHYWDAYSREAVRRGYATLAVDRLGFGRSDHPDPTELTLAAQGRVLHELAMGLRRKGFRTIVLNGHSLGALASRHAAVHGGIDALILSGVAKPGVAKPTARTARDFPFWPAEQDPKFANRSWPPGYMTTKPGARAGLFLHEGDYDPAVAAADEANKDTVPSAELAEADGSTTPPPPPGMPVLTVLGRFDALYCPTTGDCRTDPAGTGAHIVERSGHCINLGHGAPDFYRLTFSWLSKEIAVFARSSDSSDAG
ncbi:alpha/beta hydrolase [Allokutzneria sp. A3M-2-11 16]|uniref:alpha/beta hydrolase n=1 Tax=Allokutzneria sp. A3M-2-11 16 TaxID=2962043 RepID=UPI0020B65036|nr:alpha/beta hydrolase [Allokutzneria sp. A3M-2-11 16]MCP3805330.1 alpha/beta hydrolase [Allokutzneria sp. A3M-2-11 16]